MYLLSIVYLLFFWILILSLCSQVQTSLARCVHRELVPRDDGGGDAMVDEEAVGGGRAAGRGPEEGGPEEGGPGGGVRGVQSRAPQREAQEMERDPLRSRKFRFRKFRRLRWMGRGVLGECLWMRKGVRLRKARGRVEGLLRRCLGGGKVAMTLIGRWEILCESNLNPCALSSPTM